MNLLLFIHRSVGNNLINDSGLYKLLENQGANFEFSDYDNNTGILRDSKGSKKLSLKFPNDNTKPSDYAELFSEQGKENYGQLFNLVMSYDAIAIKSCYPNLNIKSDNELESIKASYQSIVQFFLDHPDKKLIILKSPALRPFATSAKNTNRARQLADSLSSESFGSNVSVFNLFDLLASDKNVLKREYRRPIPFDNHPNKKAASVIAPKLISHFLRLITKN